MTILKDPNWNKPDGMETSEFIKLICRQVKERREKMEDVRNCILDLEGANLPPYEASLVKKLKEILL